jgi:hypothetical protein
MTAQFPDKHPRSRGRKRLLRLSLIGLPILAVVFCAAVWYKLNQGYTFVWLGDYIWNSPSFEPQDGVVDIIFVVVDHWEPGGHQEPLRAWMEGYRPVADKHVDADGVKLKHSWFYPIEQFRGYEVDSLMQLCREGYGEIEIHLHHRGDDSLSLRRLFEDGIDSLQAHGALRSPDGATRFAFVHGNWALDNSRLNGSHDYCGVNNEISLLLDLGCYADFTFPSLGQESQPSFVNKIYYCQDDPLRPKSYDTGVPSAVGLVPADDAFMIFEGPLTIDWSNWQFVTHPNFEDGNLYWEIEPSLKRFEVWLSANVHVQGRPNWVFVRPFTHGCELRHPGAFENILGSNFDHMLSDMEAHYNDGRRYRLHYMTAREAYNVVKAAEAGLDGNPNDYRDYILKPYLYDPSSSAGL